MPAKQVIDLGTNLIKFVEVDGDNLKKSLIIPNPLGKVQLESSRDVGIMAEALKKAMMEVKFEAKKVGLVVPESAVYSSVISLPVLSDTELASTLQWEAEQYVPAPLNEVELSWEVVSRPTRRLGNEKMSVLLVAANKILVQGLVNVLASLNLEPEQIEPELLATARLIYTAKDQSNGPVIVSCFGASGVSLGVFRSGELILISKYASGGLALTRAISQSLQLPLPQAEEYKRTYGVKQNVLENRLLAAMTPVLDGLVAEIRRIQGFFSQKYPNEKLTRMLLVGGSALMPGLLTYLSAKSGIEVAVGDPMRNVKSKQAVPYPIVYSAAIGAAIR